MKKTQGERTPIPVRRAAMAIGAILLAAFAAWSADLHRYVVRAVELSGPLMTRDPVGGALLFVGLAALSAVLVFFSGMLLVPFGVHMWGEAGCLLLLWSGWLLGGILTYAIGRRLGWPIVRWVLSRRLAAEYEARIPESRSFWPVLLAQLALPSEAVGYICGMLKVPPVTYVAALAVAELPYALGTVLLGTAFLRGKYLVLLSVALAGLLVLGWVWWRQRKSRDALRLHDG
jgi:uncharacterized membrane protein YdjX (TVP38/TMEM64 family)